MKKIICILLSVLFAVSLVSARLGDELVTCADFTCNDEWVGLPEGNGVGWWWLIEFGEFIRHAQVVSERTDTFSQDISIQIGKSYNVSINVNDFTTTGGFGSNELNFTLGGVKQGVFTDFLISQPETVFSYIITATTTEGIFVNGTTDNNAQIFLNSVSVKEIIEIPTIFIRHNNEEIQIPYTFFERKENDAWVIDLPKSLFRRFVRWIKG